MFETYRVIQLDEEALDFKVKYRYLVMKFCGANAKQKPIYRLVRQERTEAKALEYIAKHSQA